MKKVLKDAIKPFSFMLIIPVLNVFYVLLNNGEGEVHSLMTDLDRSIPLVEGFVIPYVIWYPFIAITMLYLCIKDRKNYFVTLVSYVLGLIVCYVTYVLFQTHVPRPVLVDDGFFTQILKLVYRHDQPFNAFPSIHVLSCYLMMKAIHMSTVKNWRNQLVIHSLSVTIIFSTLFVKQHVILDVVAGILVAELLYRIVDFYFKTDRVRVSKKRTKTFFPF